MQVSTSDIYPMPSMKVPPKRKGNSGMGCPSCRVYMTLNESPSEKEGKFVRTDPPMAIRESSLNESPSEKEGKFWLCANKTIKNATLNESPSEKEGK